MAPVREEVVQGGNIQAIVARAAMQYGALRHRRDTNTGNCKCAGGSADISCVGCDPKPVYRKYRRVAASDGRDGIPGLSIQTHLSPGLPGQAGTGIIIVRMGDGTRQTYSSKYNLELVGFDVEDGNGDGIFEPGDFLYVRRIRVRNSGQSSVIGYYYIGLLTSNRRNAFTYLSHPNHFEQLDLV